MKKRQIKGLALLLAAILTVMLPIDSHPHHRQNP